MRSILDKSTREELTIRINNLLENSQPLWGKMNVYQMLKHCCLAEEMFLGKKIYKRALLGRIFGKIALKNMTKDERKLSKNAKTSSVFRVTGDGDIAEQKKRLVELINEYETFSNENIVHWFFGKMTKEQVGIFSYKHIDHHLRQFNS